MRDTKGRRIIPYSGEAPDTIDMMVSLVDRMQSDFALLQRMRDKGVEIIRGAGVEEYDNDGIKAAVFDWVNTHTYWTEDPTVEYMTVPEVLLNDIETTGYASEDCESLSTLQGSLLFGLGQPFGYRVTFPLAEGNGNGHVYVVAPVERGGIVGARKQGSPMSINGTEHWQGGGHQVAPGELIAWDVSQPDRDFGYEEEGEMMVVTVMI